MFSWRPGQRHLELSGDLEVPEEPDDLLACFLSRDGAVANALTRTFSARRALLAGHNERRPQ
jgi:hypothetical protein